MTENGYRGLIFGDKYFVTIGGPYKQYVFQGRHPNHATVIFVSTDKPLYVEFSESDIADLVLNRAILTKESMTDFEKELYI